MITLIQAINESKTDIPCLSKVARASTSGASSIQMSSPLDPEELEVTVAAGGATFCADFCKAQLKFRLEVCLKYCTLVFTKGALTYLFLFGENILSEALQRLGGDVVLLHDKPLSHRAESLLSHLPLVVTPSLRVSLKALVQTVPLPHFLKCKGPEAALSINGPVYIHFKVAGDWRKQLHIFEQVILHPLVMAGSSLWMAILFDVAIKDAKILNAIINS